jgi:hypothetical protein
MQGKDKELVETELQRGKAIGKRGIPLLATSIVRKKNSSTKVVQTVVKKIENYKIPSSSSVVLTRLSGPRSRPGPSDQ